ncbi:MAG: hypothetical protein K2K90_04940 [Lachnospiraceae bacterium]|nr:hypothetical protein [Lachnospiraceae bacterium]
MNTSIDNLKALIEGLGEDWKTKLDAYLKNENVELDRKCKDGIEDFLQSCMEEIKDNKVSHLQKVEKKIDNDLLYNNLKKYLDDLLWTFYAFAPLRVLGAVNSKEACEIMEQVFDCAVLRYHPNIMQEYEKYHFDNGNAFVDFLNAQDGLCSYMIEKNMHYDVMINFVYMQTRLPKELCKRLVDMVDKSFNELRMNYIIGKLNSLSEFMDRS